MSSTIVDSAGARPARILVTGSAGLVGVPLETRLRALGHEVSGLDVRARSEGSSGDIRDPDRLRRAIDDRDGIIHLAAISRVIWAEHEPELCWSTNVEALRELLRVCLVSPRRPWVVFVSSREVYGQPELLPVTEASPLEPVNTYGRTKVAGERLCGEAASAGLRVAIIRLSNVFGSALDHADRVVPAFVRAALAREPLRVEGAGNTFDFTHVDDAVSGLLAVVELLQDQGEAPPPVHLLTGVPTSLSQLAASVLRLAGSASPIVEARPRSFDVARFYGDPARARSLLGWQPRVPLETGLTRLIAHFRELEMHDLAVVGAR